MSRQEEARFSLTEVLATPGGAGGALGPELEIITADNGVTSLHRSLVLALSPMLRYALMTTPPCVTPTIIMPGVSERAVTILRNIITRGELAEKVTVTREELAETEELFGILGIDPSVLEIFPHDNNEEEMHIVSDEIVVKCELDNMEEDEDNTDSYIGVDNDDPYIDPFCHEDTNITADETLVIKTENPDGIKNLDDTEDSEENRHLVELGMRRMESDILRRQRELNKLASRKYNRNRKNKKEQLKEDLVTETKRNEELQAKYNLMLSRHELLKEHLYKLGLLKKKDVVYDLLKKS